MSPSLRSSLLGTQQTSRHRYRVLGLALGVFVTSFVAYSLGIFSVSGGLVWIPMYAVIVGMIAGCWVGYSQSGLLSAWVVTYTSLLGYHADHAVSQLSGFTEQFVYFVRPDGLVFLGVEAIVFGTVAFLLGSLMRWGIHLFRSETTHSPSNNG